ncbi:acyl-CoA N-acyltransferase [Aspergillus pseudonomiae]|uniref:N-alpha-acetyltransferase 40 n=1 Tax=Aspergillus pseudonomiae TaxID=1506151 RepID=A0A5N7DD10_9EURO|nr:acyl-CoA N-acyltransferase [Aspergillus pseudonomiae]KAB8265893.1 acyl-CoA N-acyltransferase [Aspergillus pseudonomiae]KAE8404257.1 acyl-CoA N-acyltransferase [Aspergillus pseudonomiae]
MSSASKGRVTKNKSTRRDATRREIEQLSKKLGKDGQKRLPLVERTNKLSLAEFVKLYVSAEDLEYRRSPAKNPTASEHEQELHYSLDIYTADSIPDADFEACFKLIEETSSDAYKGSGWGWSPKKKMKEMRLPDMRYLILRQGSKATPENIENAEGGTVSSTGQLLGFTSFMVTYEDGKKVIYCYEIHLSSAAQGQGLGSQLMIRLANIGRRIGLEKVMLTVFRSNEKAVRFYYKLGFTEDEYSPPPRILRNGMVKEPDYMILSKSLRSNR